MMVGMNPLLLVAPLLLSGCGVAKAIVAVPIAVGEAVYDTATQSEEEADIKRGKALRETQERAQKERRRAQKTRRRAEREVQGKPR